LDLRVAENLKEIIMKVALTAGVLALALAVPAFAETAQDVPGSSTEGMKSMEKNPGALTAAEKDRTAGAGQSGGMSDGSSANVPGANADSDPSAENQGSLSAPEKDAQ
jgi:hypothetical protein